MESERGSDYAGKEISMHDDSTMPDRVAITNSMLSGKHECCCNAKNGADQNGNDFEKMKCICGCDIDASSFNLPSKMTIGKSSNIKRVYSSASFALNCQSMALKASVLNYLNEFFFNSNFRNPEGKPQS